MKEVFRVKEILLPHKGGPAVAWGARAVIAACWAGRGQRRTTRAMHCTSFIFKLSMHALRKDEMF
jgi:hypothetical protein